MRALVVHQWTSFENLKIEESWPMPVIQPGTVRIRTQAVGMNFALSLRVQGKYQIKPDLPHVPGIDACGIVTEIGVGVTQFSIGDRVTCFVNHGAFAEECIVPEHRAFKLPDEMDFRQAVGFPSSHMTSYIALVWPQWIHLQFGETILIHGAAGGVGLAAIDIAKILGARVIATCGSEEKMAVCRSHGADHVINYRTGNFVAEVMEFTQNAGVNAVYDPVGGDTFMQSLRCLAPEGRIVPIGFASGVVPQIPANILLVKNLKVLALNAGYYNGQWGTDPTRHKDMGKVYEPQIRAGMNQMFRWVVENRMIPENSHTFTFDQYKEAMATVLSRDSIGKVAVVFDQEANRLGF
ncbi:MAG: NADPH:quinone oxidoreductase family protein [Pseudomonadota bacterium]